jgi:hypothetical protein
MGKVSLFGFFSHLFSDFGRLFVCGILCVAGEDAGVVYSEMQGRENGSGDLMALR